MPVLDLGKVVGDPGASMRFRGEWNNESEYFNNASYIDAVTHNGSLWICKITNTNQVPATGTYWGIGAQGMAEENMVFSAYSAFPSVGDENKLYIDNTVNPALMYIWDGSAYVPAGGGGEVAAEDVTYDNASSGLTAQTVQEAIDENAEAISALNSRITIITSTVKYNEWTYLNFPTGFNRQNCIIISLFLIVDGSLFSSDMSAYLTQYVNSELQFEAFVRGTDGNIGVKANTERNEGKTIAIVLLKIK